MDQERIRKAPTGSSLNPRNWKTCGYALQRACQSRLGGADITALKKCKAAELRLKSTFRLLPKCLSPGLFRQARSSFGPIPISQLDGQAPEASFPACA